MCLRTLFNDSKNIDTWHLTDYMFENLRKALLLFAKYSEMHCFIVDFFSGQANGRWHIDTVSFSQMVQHAVCALHLHIHCFYIVVTLF